MQPIVRACSAMLAIAMLAAACDASPSPSVVARASAGSEEPSSASSGSARPAPSGPGSTNPPLPTGPDALELERIVEGLASPIGIANAGDGSGRLFVLEQIGRVRAVEPNGRLRPEPFIDISNRVLSGGERGLLGIAFHPDFRTNRRLFLHYSRAGDGATVVSEFRAAEDRRTADPGSERVVLTQAQPFPNHNGGQLAFGPDGYLYLGLGDGGSGGDPLGNAQDIGVLLGKILRLDVDASPAGQGYAIPPDNPFAPQGVRPGGGRPEIWAYGLRNPWQFSFDPEGGDLYIADVGQNAWEEVNRQPGDSRGGENYGWDVMEGRHCFERAECDQSPYVKPIAWYSHDRGDCSVTGGHVYRGTRQPELQGVYVFGDYCSGLLFTLQVDEGTRTPKVVLESGLRITAFGTDEDGEIYVASIDGTIHRVLVAD